jgi:hypothetical protein
MALIAITVLRLFLCPVFAGFVGQGSLGGIGHRLREREREREKFIQYAPWSQKSSHTHAFLCTHMHSWILPVDRA